MIIINNQTKEQIIEDLDYKQSKKALTKAQKEQKLNQLDELEKDYEKYRGKRVNCDLYQLVERIGNSMEVNFTPDHQKLLRKDCSIEIQHYVNNNWRHAESGRLYVINVEKTEKQIEEAEQMKLEAQERAQLEAEVGEEVSNTLKAIGQAAKQKVGRPAKK